MSVVELEQASLHVGGRTILSHVSFAVEAGEFIGVLGPNGAGKTTLMRALLGLLRPSGGTVRVFGKLPQRGNPLVGYMPQSQTLVPNLRLHGFDLIAGSLNGSRWGLPMLGSGGRRMIDEVLTAIGAHDLAGRPLAEMSGGERQQLLLAQALIGEPRLLLLDEPLIGLDHRHQEGMIELVRGFCRKRNITVLFSAHELNQLVGALDRVLYLGNGSGVLGTVAEVVTAPVLSRLYGSKIDVIEAEGHTFVLSHGRNVEHADHLHHHHA